MNALPGEIKQELVLCDQVSVDFTTKDQLWMAVLWVDHAFDSLKAISAYKGDQVPGMPHTNHKSSNFNKRVNPAMLVKNASTKLALILHIIHGQIQLRLNCIIITQIIDTLILVNPEKL